MDSFTQRKNDVLSKKDKSSLGNWDKKIIKVCDKINFSEKHYTTSSCSGRVMIIKDEEKKSPGLIQFTSHERLDFEDFISQTKKIKEGTYKFKQESVIFHIACKNLVSAEELLKKGQKAGFKRTGIISLSKNIVLEINSTEKMEFPLIEKGTLLVSEEFLEKVIQKANRNLKKGWEKIKVLENLI